MRVKFTAKSATIDDENEELGGPEAKVTESDKLLFNPCEDELNQ